MKNTYFFLLFFICCCSSSSVDKEDNLMELAKKEDNRRAKVTQESKEIIPENTKEEKDLTKAKNDTQVKKFTQEHTKEETTKVFRGIANKYPNRLSFQGFTLGMNLEDLKYLSDNTDWKKTQKVKNLHVHIPSSREKLGKLFSFTYRNGEKFDGNIAKVIANVFEGEVSYFIISSQEFKYEKKRKFQTFCAKTEEAITLKYGEPIESRIEAEDLGMFTTKRYVRVWKMEDNVITMNAEIDKLSFTCYVMFTSEEKFNKGNEVKKMESGF